jgi:DNA-directed RNA polymerase sigma subunit (sigma70/sigma32)
MKFDNQGNPINFSCIKKNQIAKKVCNLNECRFNILNENYLNCSLIASEKGPLTLQEIGETFDLSRMRICQIEKAILSKLKNNLNFS